MFHIFTFIQLKTSQYDKIDQKYLQAEKHWTIQ